MDEYYQQAQQMYSPFQKQAEEAMRARLADQGLLSSTGGQGWVQRTGDEWRGRAIEWGTQQGNTMRDFAERVRQYNQGYDLQNRQFADSQKQFSTQQAMRAWELQNALALSRQQWQGDDKGVTWAKAPTLFSDLYKTRYMGDPLEQRGDPIEQRPKGDPNNPWPQYAQNYGKGLAARQEDRVASDNAAERALRAQLAAEDRALQERELALRERGFEAEFGEPDEDQKWSIMAGEAAQNRTSGQAEPGTNLLPTQLMAKWKAEFGIDIEQEIKAGNPQAIGLIYTMYSPETAKTIIARIQGVKDVGASFSREHVLGGGGAPKPSLWQRLTQGGASPAPRMMSEPNTYPVANPNPFRR